MQGTVMKITKDNLVVLCEDGTFRNLPKPEVLPGLGEQISVTSYARNGNVNRRNIRLTRTVGSVAASVLLLIGIVFLFHWMKQTSEPLTQVAIDINPSIQLGVTSTGKVREVNLVNDEAKLLITPRQLKGKTFSEAVGQIIAQAKRDGYLEAGTAKTWIWMTLIPPENSDAPAYSIDRSSLPISDSYKLELFTATPVQVEKAEEARLSVNKYMVYEQAQAQGVKLDIAELRTHSIVSVLQAVGITPASLFEHDANTEKPAAAGGDLSSEPAPSQKTDEDLNEQQPGPNVTEGQEPSQQKGNNSTRNQPPAKEEEKTKRSQSSSLGKERQPSKEPVVELREEPSYDSATDLQLPEMTKPDPVKVPGNESAGSENEKENDNKRSEKEVLDDSQSRNTAPSQPVNSAGENPGEGNRDGNGDGNHKNNSNGNSNDNDNGNGNGDGSGNRNGNGDGENSNGKKGTVNTNNP
ncbi:anti-sigma-I factor RsgI family protein [Paenibacillus timonensis]|uniref:anti-sigma-I factor RsgI family protein n=1 Tax=Paenibacillus timonensis TaxID=225915 RepID=UPI003F9D3619